MHDSDRKRRDDESGFMRWSRRKAAARSRPSDAAYNEGDTEASRMALVDRERDSGSGLVAESKSQPLPDPERMDASSDFSVFLRDGVASTLRRAALRRLWTLDPVFSHQDGLVEYGEDFTDGAKANLSVRTGYRIASDLAQKLAESAESDLAGKASTRTGADESADAGTFEASEDNATRGPKQSEAPDSEEQVVRAAAQAPRDRDGRR